MRHESHSRESTELPVLPAWRFSRRPTGLRFSLRSVLIAMVMVSAVLAMLVPFIGNMIDGKKQMQCYTHLAQIGLALRNYDDVYGSLPPAYLANKAGEPLLSWRVLILPFLGYNGLYSQIKFDEPWNSSHNIRLASLMPANYRCPADVDAELGETSYVAVTGPETPWPGAKSRQLSNTRRSDETILVVEVAHLGISWMEPRDLPLRAAMNVARNAESGIACRHPCRGGDGPMLDVRNRCTQRAVGCRPYGAKCVFGDGFVDTVSEDVLATILGRMATAGRELTSFPH